MMRLVLKRTIQGGLLLSFVAVLSSSYWLFASNAGLRWVLIQANLALGNSLTYTDVQGTLTSEISWQQLGFTNSTLEMHFSHPKIQLGFSKLITSTLGIEQLSIEKLTVRTKDTAAKSTTNAGASISLPLLIDLRQLSIDALEIQQIDNAPLQLTKVHLDRAQLKHTLEFQNLSFSTEYGTLSASGQWPFNPKKPLHLMASLQTLANADLPILNGQVDLQGPLDNIAIDATLAKPLTMHLIGQLNASADLPNWSVQLSGNDLALQAVLHQNETVLRQLDVHSEGTWQNFSLQIKTQVQHPKSGQWTAELNAQQVNNAWTINQLRLTEPIHNRSLSAQGTVHTRFDFSDTTQADIQLAWENLAWPIDSESGIGSHTPTGSLNLTGQLLDYKYQLNTELAFADHQIHTLHVQGSGNNKQLMVEQFTGKYLNGNWQGSGSATLTDGLRWELAANVADLDVAGFDPRWPSKLNSEVQHKGQWVQGKVAVYTHFDKIVGKLSNQRVRGSGDLNYTDDYWQLKGIDLSSGKSTVKGEFTEQFSTDLLPTQLDAQWNINITDLSPYYPGVAGALKSTGKYQSNGDKFRMTAKANSRGFGFEDVNIDDADLNADLDLIGNNSATFTLHAKNAQLAGQSIKLKTLVANLTGKMANHELELAIQTEQGDQLNVSATGKLEDEKWLGKISSTTLATHTLGNWSLQQPAPFRLSRQSRELHDYCLAHDQSGARVCANWDSTEAKDWTLAANFRQLPADIFHTWLPPQFTGIEAKFDGNAKLLRTPDNADLQGTINATAGTGKLRKLIVDKAASSVEFQHFQLQLSNQGSNLALTSSIELADIGYVKMLLAFPHWYSLSIPDVDQPIAGAVDVELQSMAFISLLTEDLHNVVGHWSSHLRLDGKLGAPLILGTSNIDASQLSLPQLGLTLKSVKLNAESKNDRTLAITGSAQSGNGQIKLQGILGDYRTDSLVGKLQLEGESFEAIRVPEAVVVISPKLTLDLQKQKIHAEGDIHIDEALFQIYMPATSITPSSDVIIVNNLEPEKIDKPQTIITSAVRIIVGDKVKIQGYGFTGRLKGIITINQTATSNTATGELGILDGKYNAYGRELDISEGKLSFTGGLIQNPIVHIKAVKRPNPDLIVGIVIDGEAKDPKIQLFAEPPLEDADILSYIILGYPIKDAKAKDGDMLATAAASLGLMGGEKLVKYIAGKFGIDEVKLESDSTTQAARLVLGKYLSPELYIRYAYGIGQTANTLQLQYKLTDQWVIKTESGDVQNSAEIQFIKERD